MAAAQATIERNELQAAEIERTRGENKQKNIRRRNRHPHGQRAAPAKRSRDHPGSGRRTAALTDERERMSGEMARLAERRAAAENELNTTAAKLWTNTS